MIKTPKSSSLLRIAIAGNARLTRRIAEKLLNLNCKITCFLTIDPYNIAWCQEHKIATLNHQNELLNHEYDYLISAINPYILKRKIITHAKKFSINYHNSLLPKYAGRNASSWSLINNEESHGITWHIIDDQIDSGPILLQRKFEIRNDDTALSLETRCQEAALESLEELLYLLDRKQFLLTPQEKIQRTYHTIYEIPDNAGFLNFTYSVDTIERLFNACHFSDHTNPFCTLKLLHQSKFIILKKIQIYRDDRHPKPGVITKINQSSLTISLSTGELSIEKATTPSDTPLSGKEIASYLSLNLYEAIDSTQIKQKQLNEFKISNKNSSFWRKKLEINFNRNTSLITKNQHVETSYHYKNKKFHLPRTDLNLIVAGIIFLIEQSNGENQIDTYFHHSFLGLKQNSILTNLSPISYCSDQNKSLKNNANKLKEELAKIIPIHSPCGDILARYPQLSATKKPPTLSFSLNSNSPNLGLNPIWEPIININFKEKTETTLISINYLTASTTESCKIVLDLLEDYLSNLLGKKTSLLRTVDFSKNHKNSLNEWSNIDNIKWKKRAPSITTCFDEIVKKHGDKIALKNEKVSLSYYQIQFLAKQLSAKIKTKTNRSQVAILIEHRLLYPIVMLAILASGKSYTPINAEDPPNRIKYILVNSDIDLVISDKTVPHISSNAKLYILDINKQLSQLSNTTNNHNRELGNTRQPAYVMYTSGTTAAPKGVIINQSSVVNLVKNNSYINIQPNDTFIQLSNIAFDASTFEVWGALLNGATLVCPIAYSMLDITQLSASLDLNKVSILWLTKSVYDLYIKHSPAIFSKLSYLIIGGEKLNKETLNVLLRLPKKQQPKHILNGYGPTETTTFSTTYEFLEPIKKEETVPIGKPIDNTGVIILNSQQNICPPGIPGVLYICGHGIAEKYLSNRESENEKFITLKSINNKNHKYFKTDDITYWNRQGNIIYLSRNDSQIKIRGFRVNLDSIKEIILQHKDVDSAIVHSNIANNIIDIVAYIKKTKNSSATEESIINFLKSHLPIYAIPSRLYIVDTIPLNANGKIDYNYLGQYCEAKEERPDEPKNLTETQQKLLKIWKSILPNPNYNTQITNNFFDSGGDSLLTADLLLKIRKLYKIDISIKSFLENPTILGLESLINSPEKSKPIREHFSETTLPKSISLLKNPDFLYCKSKSILLTGASGFLGSYILSELVKIPHIKIYCLLRHKNSCIQNLTLSLNNYKLSDIIEEKVEIVTGDLSTPNLGLAEKQYNMLCKTIDIIIHAAANIHHIYDYDQLKSTNVEGTLELLKIAGSRKPKLFNLISTVSAIADKNGAGFYSEQFPHAIPTSLDIPDGYSQTKWSSEKLLTEAHQNYGLPINIIRYSWLTGDQKNGIINGNLNHMFSLLKGCIQLGYAPSIKMSFNCTPVDFAASSLVALLFQENIKNTVINSINPAEISFSKLIDWLNEYGYHIEIIPLSEWRNLLCDIDSSNALFRLLPLYLGDKHLDRIDSHHIDKKVACNNLKFHLSRIGKIYPKITKSLMFKYFDHLTNSRFFPPVQQCQEIEHEEVYA